MSVKRIIQESIDKNPLGVKEALEEALQDRVRAALEEKYAEMTESKDEDDDDEDDDEDDDMDESFDLSDYTLEELEDFMMSEDFDQLDEISKKTLASYVKKAGADEKRLDKKADYHDDMSTKYRRSAMNKNLDSKGHEKDYDRYKKHQDSATKALAKSRQRGQGIARATDRLAK